MGKTKDARIIITLECLCNNSFNDSNITNKKYAFRYTTTKNRRNTPNKLSLKKFCPQCNCHSSFQEIK